jgi:hypothetical protein
MKPAPPVTKKFTGGREQSVRRFCSDRKLANDKNVCASEADCSKRSTKINVVA